MIGLPLSDLSHMPYAQDHPEASNVSIH